MDIPLRFDIEDFSSYNIIDISNICEKNNGYCKHCVTLNVFNTNQKITGVLRGDIIVKYFKYHNIKIPDHYLEFVCPRYNLN